MNNRIRPAAIAASRPDIGAWLLLAAALLFALPAHANNAQESLNPNLWTSINTDLQSMGVGNANIYAYVEQGTQVPFYYEQNGYTPVRPANTATLVTVYLVLKAVGAGQITLGDAISVPTIADAAQAGWANKTPLHVNETVTVGQLVNLAMTGSRSDAAVALAYYLSGGYDQSMLFAASQAAQNNGNIKPTRYTNIINMPVQFLPPPSDGNPNSAANTAWLQAFGDIMTYTATHELGAMNKSTFCGPAGLDALTSSGGGCGTTSVFGSGMPRGQVTARDMATIAQNIRINLGVYNNAAINGALGSTVVTNHAILSDAGYDSANYSTTAPFAGALSGGGTILLAKSGASSVRNLVSSVQLAGSDDCMHKTVNLAVMGLSSGSGSARDYIAAKIVSTIAQAYGCTAAYDTGNGEAMATQMTTPESGKTVDTAMQNSVLPQGGDAIGTVVTISQQDYNDASNDGGSSGSSGGGGGSYATPPQVVPDCDPDMDAREQRGVDSNMTAASNIVDKQYEYQVQEAIMHSQCFGKLLTMLNDFQATASAIASSSAGLVTAVVVTAAAKILDGIQKQMMNSIMNSVCNVSNNVYNTLDSVSKNALCMPPIFKNPNNPLDIGDISLGQLSCSGLSLDVVAAASNNPNASVTNGSLYGVSPNVSTGNMADLQAAAQTLKNKKAASYADPRYPNAGASH